MLPIISVYCGYSDTVMEIHCPKCKSVVDVGLGKFVMAINTGESFWCAHCWSNIKVSVDLLDPPARTSDTAETGIREACPASNHRIWASAPEPCKFCPDCGERLRS